MLLQQSGHSKGREAGGQGIALQGGVTAINDRADDRGIGGGASDSLLFQHLHQGCFAETGRRLGLVTERFHLLWNRGITHRQSGQEHFLALKGRIGVITALDVGAKEAGEIDPLAAGSEAGLSRAEIDRQHGQPCFRHLAGDGAFPDEVIDRQITALQPGVPRGAEALAGGADRFMSLLGIACLGAELTRPLAQILLAVKALHTAAGGADRLIGKVNRVGSHVGDETALVKALGAAHRFPR